MKANQIDLKSVKINSIGLEASYVYDGKEIKVKGKDPIHPDLRSAINALVPYFVEVCEMHEAEGIDWKNLEGSVTSEACIKFSVSGIELGGSENTLGLTIIGHKLLPDRDISGAELKEAAPEKKEFVPVLSNTQQTIVYVGYVVMVVAMIFLDKLPGEAGYALPLVIAGLFLCVGVLNFKEMIGNMFSPVMIMMASVIGVAATMANCGLSGFLGEKVAGMLGGNPSLMVLVFVFTLMTSVSATLTGASFGSIFIFAPIGIALCLQFGYNPVPLALACVKAGWINWFLPIDGLPALAMGTGKYKLTEFWKYVLPLWVLMIAFYSVMCVVFFG